MVRQCVLPGSVFNGCVGTVHSKSHHSPGLCRGNFMSDTAGPFVKHQNAQLFFLVISVRQQYHNSQQEKKCRDSVKSKENPFLLLF